MMKFLKLLFLACILMAPYHSVRGRSMPQRPIENCQAMVPFGQPVSKINLIPICRTGYMVGYDPISKIPNWVAYSTNEEKSTGCLPRSDSYFIDTSIPLVMRSTPADYSKTGYDIGHMANAADMAWSESSITESFLMSNMTPQLPSVNRGIWKSIEIATRTWSVSRDTDLIIISGSIYNQSSTTIGNRVVVPDRLYKIIIDSKNKSYMAFIVTQKTPAKSINVAQTTISDIEKIAKIRIFVPRGIVKSRKYILWDIRLAAYQKIKKETCSVN